MYVYVYIYIYIYIQLSVKAAYMKMYVRNFLATLLQEILYFERDATNQTSYTRTQPFCKSTGYKFSNIRFSYTY